MLRSLRHALKTAFVLFCLASFSATQCGAQVLVTNNNSSGSGSLADAITQVADGSANSSTIEFNSGVSGNIAAGGPALAISRGPIIDLGNTTAFTLPEAAAVTGALTLDLNGKTGTLAGILSDGSSAGSLVVQDSAGGGTLNVNASNSYTGGTTINGTEAPDGAAVNVLLGAANALGSGSVTLSAPVGAVNLDLQNHSQSIGALSGGPNTTIELGNATLTVNSNVDTTFSGLISDNSGDSSDNTGGSIVKNGSGLLAITSSQNSIANAYTGGTTINAGTLGIAADSDLGATSGVLTFNGGALQTEGDVNSSRSITIESSQGTIDAAGKSSTFNGQITGDGGLTIIDSVGGGVITLTNILNGYNGATTINSGTLSVDNDGELGSAENPGIVFNGGTLQANGNNSGTGLSTLRSIQLSGSGTFDVNGLSSSLGGQISGSGQLTLTDSASGGSVVISGNNNYTGGTQINGDVIAAIAQNDSLGTGQITFNGGTLQTNASITVSNAISLAGNGAINANGQSSTFSGTISGSGLLTLNDTAGGGQISLSGTNNYTDGTVINSAQVQAANASAFGSGSITFNGGALSINNGITLSNNLSLNGAAGMSTSGAATLSGTISDGANPGVLSITGGNFTLNGNNTYSGGTTISGSGETISAANNGAFGTGTVTFSGASGTIQTSVGVNLANPIALSITNGNYVFDAAGNASIFSGTISGGGYLTLETSHSGGSILLGGNNTYTGNTTVASGMIAAANNSMSFGSGGMVTLDGSVLQMAGSGINIANPVTLNGGGTIDANGSNATLSGTIAGTGALTLTDTTGTGGQITLSGPNAYSAGTIINGSITNSGFSGVVVATGGQNVLGTGTVSMTGGSGGSAVLEISDDQTVGSISGDARSELQLVNAALTTGGDNTSTSFAGTITGSGSASLVKNGTGIFNLSGAWSVPSVVVNAGTLQLGANSADSGSLTVNSGGTFDLNNFSQPGTGAVVNNGTIKTGTGMLTTASYSGAGALSVTLQPSGINLQVNGAANVSGQTLNILGRPAAGNYTVINAGTLTGTFAAINMPSGFSDLATYSGTQLVLDILAVAFVQPGQSLNQSAIGNALTAASFNASPDLTAVINQLNTFSPAQLNAALDQISPVALASMSGVSYAAASLQSAAIGQRITGLQYGDTASAGSPFAYYNVSGKSAYPGTLVADAFDNWNPWGDVGGWTHRDEPITGSQWGFFGSATDTSGHLDSTTGSGGYQPGYSFSAAGATFGGDYRFQEHAVIGVSAGYVDGTSDIDSSDGYVRSQSMRGGVYGATYNDGLRSDLYIGGAEDFFDTSRDISMLSRTATASPTGQEFNASGEMSYDLRAKAFTLTPFLGANYDRLTVDPFTESGAGSMDLSVAEQTTKSFRSSLGAKLSHQFGSGSRSLTPYVSLGWDHEFENQSHAIDAQFASGSGEAFTVTTADVARDGAMLGAGINLNWGNASFRVAYSGDIRSDAAENSFNGAARLKF